MVTLDEGAPLATVADLAAERHLRRVTSPASVIPTAIERQAFMFARGEGAEGRKRAITRHPDLAARIVQVYRLASISQWSGYVPPRDCGGYNDSPMRKVVVEACAEAWRRENTPARNSNEREAVQ